MISEYGHLGNQFPVGHPEYHATLSELLLMANNLKDWIALGIPMADRSNLTDFVYAEPPGGSSAVGAPLNSLIHGPGPDYTVPPQGLVPNLFRPLAGGTAIATEVQGNAGRLLGNGQTLLALTTVASRAPNGDLDLVVINQDAHQDVTAAIEPGQDHGGTVAVQMLTGPSILAQNLPGDTQVALSTSTVELDAAQLSYSFPARAVTRLHFTAR